MNDNYIRNECIDIFESLEFIDSLNFSYNLLELVLNGIRNNVETKKDEMTIKELDKILDNLYEIIKQNEVKNEC